MTAAKRVVIIGGVACGTKAACRLRRLDPDVEITVIEKGDLVSYGACGLPYYVEGAFDDIQELVNTPIGVPRTPPFFKNAKGVDVQLGKEALQINRDNKTITVKVLEDGSTTDLPYDTLVLAVGGAPVRPPIDGLGLENLWFMTHPNDAEGLLKEMSAQRFKRAVLVGAGFIGVEMAEALVRQGLDVTVVEMMDQIMPGVLDKDIALFSANHMRQHGVNLRLGEKVVAVTGEGKVSGVQTDRQNIPADVVVVAVGTQPNTHLAKAAGLDCNRGILINEYCQTSDPDIYAGGDCVENRYAPNESIKNLYVPLGSTANKHGRVIANHIAGMRTPFRGITTSSVVRAFDFTIGRTGLTEAQTEMLGIDVVVTTWSGPDMPHYMPESKPFVIKMIAGKNDRKLLGVQVAGMGNAAKRLDVAASIILLGGTLDDLANVDFGYAPPFSPPIDPLAACAHLLTNKMDGLAVGISAFEAKKRIENGDVVLLDVRMPEEVATVRLPYKAVCIPLGQLRSKLSELPKDKEIIAFCKVSMRGYEAQRILNANGFDRVSFIEGGVIAWPFGDLQNG